MKIVAPGCARCGEETVGGSLLCWNDYLDWMLGEIGADGSDLVTVSSLAAVRAA